MFDNFKLDVEGFTMTKKAIEFQSIMPFRKN